MHTPAQVEALTGVSPNTLSLWRHNGVLTIGTTTPGGHWRYSDDGVLWVAAVRVLSESGFKLTVAGALATVAFLEIKGAVMGRPLVTPVRQFGFIWKLDEATEQGQRAVKDMLFTYHPRNDKTGLIDTKSLTVFSEGDHGVVLTDQLDLVPLLSRAGGHVVALDNIARKIPAAVADLFTESGAP